MTAPSSWADRASHPRAVAPEACLQCHAAVTQAGSGAPSGLKWQVRFLTARFCFPLASSHGVVLPGAACAVLVCSWVVEMHLHWHGAGVGCQRRRF
jgi:hypothetical protein